MNTVLRAIETYPKYGVKLRVDAATITVFVRQERTRGRMKRIPCAVLSDTASLPRWNERGRRSRSTCQNS